MKMHAVIKPLVLAVFILLYIGSHAQTKNPENWTVDQLLQPAELAQEIQTNKQVPIIFSVGPGALIPGSVNIGMTNDTANLEKFKKQLSGLPKETNIVVYCGCCPFEHCPNVRPAIQALQDLKFTHYQLLNLSHNLKTDWIDKGYPTTKP